MRWLVERFWWAVFIFTIAVFGLGVWFVAPKMYLDRVAPYRTIAKEARSLNTTRWLVIDGIENKADFLVSLKPKEGVNLVRFLVSKESRGKYDHLKVGDEIELRFDSDTTEMPTTRESVTSPHRQLLDFLTPTVVKSSQ